MAIRSQPLLALRLSLAATRPVPGFEPSLQYSVLWVVTHIFTSWNPLLSWLRQLEALRRAAWV
jgi:hypothetical protein